MEMHAHDETKRLVAAKPRIAYLCPRLTLLGEVADMTETGSMSAREDVLLENGMCFFPNMTGNMC